ncbi:MAG: hypothetical protein ACREID_07995 [Planctomycetota bacterium]
MRDRRDYVIAALGAALLVCLGILAGNGIQFLRVAGAQDGSGNPPASSGNGELEQPGTTGVGVTINTGPGPAGAPSLETRTVASSASDSDSNNRFVAVTSPIGSGESVLFLVDSEKEQLVVYRYLRGKGLMLMAARKIDYDLKISEYKDFSDFSRNEIKEQYEREEARERARAAKSAKGG